MLFDIVMYLLRGRRQSKILKWAVSSFGDIAKDPQERVSRFIEEAAELAQAMDVSQERVMRIVGYVYSRPVGETFQEIGGVSLTLLALCESLGMSADDAEAMELLRALAMDVTQLRAKQNAKAAQGVGIESS